MPEFRTGVPVINGRIATKVAEKPKRMNAARRRELQHFVKTLVLNCVRNTPLENLHAGIGPSSKTGDYSDVKVVSPYGEIPWNNLSRISDEEMKELIIYIVDAIYTVLWSFETGRNIILRPGPEKWDEPKLNRKLLFTKEDLDRMMNELINHE